MLSNPAVLAIALRSTRNNTKPVPVIIHHRMPSQLSPLRMQPLPVFTKPKPVRQPPKKRQPAKEKAIIRPMRFDGQPMQKFHFK